MNHAARFALVGDVLFQGSVGRTDFPYGDHEALIDAIRTKLLPLGDDFSFFAVTVQDRPSARSVGATRSYANDPVPTAIAAWPFVACIRAEFCYAFKRKPGGSPRGLPAAF